ncbi:MAG: periplasmic heavy metal sensor [Lentimicrobium sp.]|jgi:Spy/CpxP family protein refolding chaperone|nr:periplasmic heavy metal sensor [Lentimicrobium sp.]
MKNFRINLTTLTAAFAMVAILSFDAAAQTGRGNGRGNGQGYGPGPGQGYGRGDCTANIPGLTEDQQTKILKLRTDHFRKAELTRAEIGEKQARMNTLRLAETQDAKAIDKNIDEIATLRGNLMKERETHRREVKALLTDEQKVWFDANYRQGRGNRSGNGMGNGNRGQRGNKQGRGMGNCLYYNN